MARLGFAVVAVLLAMGAAGCGDEADGSSSDPPSSSSTGSSSTASATSSSSPTPEKTTPSKKKQGPKPPRLPDNAKGKSAKAAAHFVEYYIELLNYASATGDVSPLRRASMKRCKGCRSYIRLYRKTYANGGYFKDSGWKPLEPTVYLRGNAATVLLKVEAPKTKFVLERGDEPKIGKAGRYKLRITVVHRDGHWSMEELAQQEGIPSAG